ncbi:MAG: hypothetical protein QOJ65_703 [Fimbriimonadaceae bacterium]|jgi:(p)ppGpp synthase/HD superfamily hydrolase|nr:hypothetical protein [Fimbriimonadaceae bacterium]
MEEVAFPRLHKAIRWATKLHKGQDRDGEAPLPYITHPLEVLSNLRFVGGIKDENLLSTAVLHDVFEETQATPERIEKKFGVRVRELVESVTRQEPNEQQRGGLSDAEIWKLRSMMLLDEIRQMKPESQLVKLADRLSNVEGALIAKSGEKLKRYLQQSEEILDIIPRSVNPGLWDAIRQRLDDARAPESNGRAKKKAAAARVIG